MGEYCSVCWRKFFTKDMYLNWLRMNRRVDSKWLKISNRPLHLYPLLHLYICLWVCAKLLQSCPTLCNPVDCSPPGSSVHRILQARILDWVAMPFSRGFFPTQGSNSSLLHCRQNLYQLRHGPRKVVICTFLEGEDSAPLVCQLCFI